MNITTRSIHYVFPTKSASRSKFLVKKKKSEKLNTFHAGFANKV